jgi:choline-sulfatase
VPPNILILMVDQLNGTLFPDGPADFLHAPNLKALAARSVRFANMLYRLAALRPGARLLHVGPAAAPHAGL